MKTWIFSIMQSAQRKLGEAAEARRSRLDFEMLDDATLRDLGLSHAAAVRGRNNAHFGTLSHFAPAERRRVRAGTFSGITV